MKQLHSLPNSLIIVVIMIVTICSETLRAQQPKDSAHQLPSGPLILKRAPDFSQWVVKTQYVRNTDKPRDVEGQAAQLKPADAGKEKNMTVQEQTFTKTRNLMRVDKQMADKIRWTNWILGNIDILVWPNGMDCIELTAGPKDAPNLHHIDIAKSDFIGFDWITPACYKGVQDYNGTACNVYEGKTSISTSEDGKPIYTDVRAYISSATRLPVALKYDSLLFLYIWNEPPQIMLAMPPHIQAFMENRNKAAKEIVTNSITPY